MKEQRKEDVFIMEYLTNIAKDQDNIFLSSTMTGNIQISQSMIINVSYLVLIKGNNCMMLPPFDKAEDLQISKSFMKKLMEKYPNI